MKKIFHYFTFLLLSPASINLQGNSKQLQAEDLEAVNILLNFKLSPTVSVASAQQSLLLPAPSAPFQNVTSEKLPSRQSNTTLPFPQNSSPNVFSLQEDLMGHLSYKAILGNLFLLQKPSQLAASGTQKQGAVTKTRPVKRKSKQEITETIQPKNLVQYLIENFPDKFKYWENTNTLTFLHACANANHRPKNSCFYTHKLKENYSEKYLHQLIINNLRQTITHHEYTNLEKQKEDLKITKTVIENLHANFSILSQNTAPNI